LYKGDIAEECGYSSVWTMLMDNLKMEELMELLQEFVDADTDGWVHDMITDIAKDKFEWFDKEQARADHEDAQYQEYKDRRAGDE
tara:strand:+ start:216 stop:470 length:255 start_codon:yes stop_codon:yes gene_type:complete